MLPFLLQAVESVGHAVFTEGQFNLNIIGIRSRRPVPDSFDDLICVVYKDEYDNWVTKSFPATTDPGLYYMNNPMNVTGTAIMMPGQYRGSYKIGMHYTYEALVQHGGTVRIWRDSNKDDVLDYGVEDQAEGYFGINIHRAHENASSETVGRWSAGCQVFQKAEDFSEFMNLCYKASEIWGNGFTYTLIVPNKFLMEA